MRSLALALVFILLPSTAGAQILVKVDGQPRAVLDQLDGQPRLTPLDEYFQQVIDLGRDPQPPPSSLGDEVSKWADEANDPATRRKLGLAYAIFVGETFDSTEEVKRAMKEVRASVLEQSDAADRWSDFVTRLDAAIDDKIVQGELQTVADYQLLAKEISEGLTRGAAGRFDLAEILAVVELVLPIIRGEEELTLEILIEVALRVLKLFGGEDRSAELRLQLREAQERMEREMQMRGFRKGGGK